MDCELKILWVAENIIVLLPFSCNLSEIDFRIKLQIKPIKLTKMLDCMTRQWQLNS